MNYHIVTEANWSEHDIYLFLTFYRYSHHHHHRQHHHSHHHQPLLTLCRTFHLSLSDVILLAPVYATISSFPLILCPSWILPFLCSHSVTLFCSSVVGSAFDKSSPVGCSLIHVVRFPSSCDNYHFSLHSSVHFSFALLWDDSLLSSGIILKGHTSSTLFSSTRW